MASNRTGLRRSNAPTPITTQTPPPKLVTSIEEWEAKAPLDQLELESIAVLKLASEHKPLPLKFTSDEAGPSRPSTPSALQRKGQIATGSRPDTPLSGSASTRTITSSAQALHSKQPIQTPEQFYDWFAMIDRSVVHSQEAQYRAHVATVTEHLNLCDSIILKIDLVDRELESMMEGWKSVEEGGKSLKDACEKLLEERDNLLHLNDQINDRLEYFQELEHATRLLNHPGESLVLQTDFLYMVERVDICIDYLKSRRSFREADIYLFRYQQCMTRAMTLIRMYFVGSLRALSVDISKRLSEKDISSTAQMHLLYTRFKTVSSQLLPLLNELERRTDSYPQELSSLLEECHSAYFATRKSLLIGHIMEEIKGMDPARTDLVELARAGCSFLKQLCTDEFELYRCFFSTGEEQLYRYLENLCDHLYDDLRPRILHEHRITVLCDVCTVLQALMVLDVAPVDDDDDNLEPSQVTINAEHISVDLDASNPRRTLGGLGRLHISHLLQMVLQDAQTRLFFKAQSVIQSDIRYYVPKSEDLAYPEILIKTEKASTDMEGSEKTKINDLFHLPSTEKQDTWYPTLRKTVWVLSQLHDFVKPAIFEDIAQEAINLCRQSLVAATDLMNTKTPLDAQLFLARHLLILKEVAQNLDLAGRESSFGGTSNSDNGVVSDALASMLSRTTSLLPDALFTSLGMPRVDESIREVKHGIDHELRRVCESIISLCTESITQPLHEWTIGMTLDPTSKPKHSKQPVKDVSKTFERACTTELQEHAGRVKVYLEDSRTVTARVLLDHIRERVEDAYELFWEASKGERETRAEVLTISAAKKLLFDACI